MGRNITGKANPNDYNLGRGIVYIALLNASGLPVAWRDVGNAPEFNISVENEDLDHVGRRSGLGNIDKSIALSKTIGISFSLDEINDENLALFFSGQLATVAGVTAFTLNTAYDLKAIIAMPEGINGIQGRWFDVKDSTGKRIYGVVAADFTLRLRINGSNTTLVLGTDYEYDEEMGRFFIIAGGSVVTAAAINGATTATFSYTTSATSKGQDEVRALTVTELRYAVKFIAENPANNGAKKEYVFHSTGIRANGDFEQIGDDWSQMSFEGTAEKSNATQNASSPVVTIRSLAPYGNPILLGAIWDEDGSDLPGGGNYVLQLNFDQPVELVTDALADGVIFLIDAAKEQFSLTGADPINFTHLPGYPNSIFLENGPMVGDGDVVGDPSSTISIQGGLFRSPDRPTLVFAEVINVPLTAEV